jgi:hypothetical protein
MPAVEMVLPELKVFNARLELVLPELKVFNARCRDGAS